MSESIYAHTGDAGNQLLADHLHGVSRRCATAADKLGLPTAGALIGLLHDLGKSSEYFQTYLKSFDPASGMEPQYHLQGKIDHSTAGAQCVVLAMANATEENNLSGFVARLLGVCIVSHHSGLIDCVDPEGVDRLQARLNRSDEKTRFAEAWDSIPASVREEAERLMGSPALLAEVNRTCSRVLGKRTAGDHAVQFGLMTRLLFSCLIDADRTDTADFENPRSARHRQSGAYVGWPVLGNRLQSHLATLPQDGHVNALRQQVSEACFRAASRPRGIYTLTVPTGGGKTLAALRFALEHARLSILASGEENSPVRAMDRVVFVSPYISIVDQNAKVARDCLEPPGSPFASIVLEHHSNLIEEKDEQHGGARVDGWRRRVLAENWDAPVVFTTMVQVLEALFGGGTRAVRRLHALANAVIIFDEVQTLPVSVVHLFNNAINLLATHCGSTVVLCTATQPLLHDVDKTKGAASLAQSAELVTDVQTLFEKLRRYVVFDESQRPGGWMREEVAALACKEATLVGSCLVVVNTKKDAREIFEMCRAAMANGAHVVHLSTAMCPSHRSVVLEDLKRRLAGMDDVPLICVSTQLIEAGVDIDFGSVIRDLAGLDSIAQAAGRCNRHGRRTQLGRVHIVALPDPPKELEEIQKGREVAAEILGLWKKNYPQAAFPLDDPTQMQAYYTRAFARRAAEMSYTVNAKDNGVRNDTLLRMLGRNSLAVEAAACAGKPVARSYLQQSFKSANDVFAVMAETQGIVVPFREMGKEIVSKLSAARDLAEEWQLLREAQRYTISVHAWQLKRLMDAGAVYEVSESAGVYCVRPEFYDESVGLKPDAGPLENLIA